ncbi:hypothetical protein fugu_015283 [Takifugu bimaculatus]|uniref:Uncharacterized protein n=1 Tax=Takifugu bimaculatus TaxID=433685 RepID=A0A4Z2BYX1_9TELE|nr:hypothetical protein fugu_015283 [Takifugu bimaculatus]
MSLPGWWRTACPGRRTELSTALLEVMQRYLSQFQLLSEIQGLRSSFAIDWRPAQRLLLYLKSAALVCHLEVEEGYPSTGRARLVSVQRNGQAVNTSGLKQWVVLIDCWHGNPGGATGPRSNPASLWTQV